MSFFVSVRVRMNCNNREIRNLFLNIKSKSEFYHVVLTTLKFSPEKLAQSVVEMQQLPDIGKSDTKEKSSCFLSKMDNF